MDRLIEQTPEQNVNQRVRPQDSSDGLVELKLEVKLFQGGQPHDSGNDLVEGMAE